jgi:hypothetical protein
MIPSPVYCRVCGGFVTHHMTDDGKPIKGLYSHTNHSDCLERMSEAITRLTSAVEKLQNTMLSESEMKGVRELLDSFEAVEVAYEDTIPAERRRDGDY